MSQLDILGSCTYNDSNSGKMSHLEIISKSNYKENVKNESLKKIQWSSK